MTLITDDYGHAWPGRELPINGLGLHTTHRYDATALILEWMDGLAAAT